MWRNIRMSEGQSRMDYLFLGIFGKRSVCPNCDKIQNRNTDQIIDGGKFTAHPSQSTIEQSCKIDTHRSHSSF